MNALRRALALGLLLAVLAAIGLGGLLPLWQRYQDNRAEIAQTRDLIARFAGIAAGLDAVEEQIGELERQREASDDTLAPESPSFAAASLQERLKLIVQRSGGTLTSTQVAPPERDGPFERVTLKVRMSLPIGALQAVLHDLESGTPYLLVDDLSVHARSLRRSAQTRSARTEQNLDVRMSLSGFMSSPGEA